MLLVLTYASVFFSRLVVAMGIPPIVNFLHFLTVAGLFGLTLFIKRSKAQLRLSLQMIAGLLLLLAAMIVSAMLNRAGLINVTLNFLLLGEPFILLIAILAVRMSERGIQRVQWWLFGFVCINVLFSYFQAYIQRLPIRDMVKGVFLNQGAGHHVSGAICLVMAIYFVSAFKGIPLWLRLGVWAIFANVLVLNDAKQVFIEFIAAFVVLVITKFKNIVQAIQYAIFSILAIVIAYWAAQILYAEAFSYWTPDRMIDGFGVKFSVFSILREKFYTPLNWLVGLGPGHTIGRLGWLIPEYKPLLEPLGVTISPITEIIFNANDADPLANAKTGSSMFSLTFSWAGVWGDLGFLGLASYVYLWVLTWRKVCCDDMSRLFILGALIAGLIFAWMEEPAFMLFVICLVGLQWQKQQLKLTKQSKKSVQPQPLFITSEYWQPEIRNWN